MALMACAIACAPARSGPATSSSRDSPAAGSVVPAPEASGRSADASPAASAAQPVIAASAPSPAGGFAAPVAQLFGPLAQTTLDVPPWIRSEPFTRPRALNLPAGFRARVFAAGLA